MNESVREPKWSRVATGPTKRRWTCEKDHVRVKMEQEQSKHDCDRDRKRKRRDTASEESIKGRRKSLTD